MPKIPKRLTVADDSGTRLEMPDGTVLRRGKVVKAGTNAIVKGGKLVGFKRPPAGQTSS